MLKFLKGNKNTSGSQSAVTEASTLFLILIHICKVQLYLTFKFKTFAFTLFEQFSNMKVQLQFLFDFYKQYLWTNP